MTEAASVAPDRSKVAPGKGKGALGMTATPTLTKEAALVAGDRWWPVQTPVGEVVLTGDDQALHRVYLPGDPRAERAKVAAQRGRSKGVASAEEQLGSYFAGELTDFELPLDAQGSEWQRRVWRELQDIPFGQTRSYRSVASAVGNPKAARAVGRAAHANPLPIVIPCHRVLGSSGSLLGFAGGLDLKAALLVHERDVLAKRRLLARARQSRG
jgi:methylated-DNA-[protein]-cysteine S-methyltransferase